MARLLGKSPTTVGMLALGSFGLLVVTALAFRPPKPLAVPKPGAVLDDVNMINPGGEHRSHVDLTIRGGRIEKIADHIVSTEARAHQHFAGRYVLPGLIDLHVHSTQDPSGTSHDIELFSLLYLAEGVTAVRDTGNFDGTILKTRAAITKGQFAGPRIFACGPIFDGDPPFWPGSLVVHNADEARRGVDQVAAKGVDCIKAYSFLTADALAGLRQSAAKHGLPIIGHVPLAVPFEDAHLDDVQHLTGVPRAIRTTGGGTGWAQSWIQLDAARIDFIVRTSVEEKVAHTPTIVVWQQMAALADYTSLLQEPEAMLLPRYYRELLWKPGGLINTQDSATDSWRTLGRALPNMILMVRRLHEAGVTLHVGTDVLNPFVVPGVSLHRELRNFVEAGFTPEQALEAATRSNGAALREPKLGTIEEGAPADLALYEQDPTRDLAALSTLEAVVANGRLYSKGSIDRAVAGYRHRFNGWIYDHATMFIARFFAARAQRRN